LPRRPTDVATLTLRIREALRRKLQRAAERHDQSLNSELIDRLEASFDAANTQALLGMLIDGPEESTRLLTCVAAALQLSRGWKTDLRTRQTLRVATGLLVEACATGEVPAEIAAEEVPPEVRAAGIALAMKVFEPREKIFKPLEQGQ
jgi:hypothetical protein